MTGKARTIQGNDLLLTLHFRRHIGRARPRGARHPAALPSAICVSLWCLSFALMTLVPRSGGACVGTRVAMDQDPVDRLVFDAALTK